MSGAGTGNLVALFKIDSTGAQASMTAAEISTAKALESMKRQFVMVSTRVKELESGTKALSNASHMVKATQDVVRYGQAAELSAKQQARAFQMLPAQISDIGVSLASGQNPLLILIQQGSQIKDMFGGFGGAFRALTSYITPTTVALTAAGAAVTAVGLALYEGQQDAKEFANGLLLTNNAAGLTEASMRSLSQRVAAATNVTAGAARDTLQALANTGRFGPQEIEKVAVGVLRLSAVSGQEAEKMIASFANIKDGVVKWALEQNKQLNFMTPALYAAAKAAEDMGDKSAALTIVLDALNKQGEKTASTWVRIKNALTEAIVPGAIRALASTPTPEDSLAAVQARIAQFQDMPSRGPFEERVLEDQRRKARSLIAARDRANAEAEAAAKAARVKADGLAAVQSIDPMLAKSTVTLKKRLDAELALYQKFFADAKAAGREYSQEEQNAVLAGVRKKFESPDSKAGDSFIKQLERQVEQQKFGRIEMLELEAAQRGVSKAAAPYIAQLAEIEGRAQRIRRVVEETAESEIQRGKITRLVSAGDSAAVGYIRQAEDIGLTADALERLNFQRRIEADLQAAMAGADSDTRSNLYAIAERNIRLAGEALTAYQEKRQAFLDKEAARKKDDEEAKKRQAERAKEGQEQVKTLEDSIMHVVRNGKRGFADLFNTMAEEFIRNMIRMAAQKTLLDETGSFVGWGQGAQNAWAGLASFAGNYFGGGAMQNIPVMVGEFGGSHAGGLDYVPYDGYVAALHKGERVQRSIEANSDRARGAGMVQNNDQRVIVQGDVGAKALRAIRAGQNMQAARMAYAERY